MFWESLGIGLVAKMIIKDIRRNKREEREREERKSNEVEYDDILTEEIFEEIVDNCARKIKRISYWEVNNGEITVTVKSQSGITKWDFEVDFNDYGEITGAYWITSENDDSEIPNTFAEMVRECIVQIYKNG